MIHDATAQPDWGYENDEFGPSESNFVWNIFQKSSREDSNDVLKCETKGGVLHFH